jgi:hypothetical protein
MRLYDPDVISQVLAVIAGGAIMTAALIWMVDRVWPRPRPEHPALRDEAPERAGAPMVSNRR